MIISHRHRYLFVELPHTGSTAISRELRDMYDGVSILGKHSTYKEFLRWAGPVERRYFVFSGIRNPLDVAVTKYFKYKTDHKNRYTDQYKVALNRGPGNSLDRAVFRHVQRTSADFSSFFLTFYRFPYNSWACLDHKGFDLVVRFENLADDFDRALRAVGIEPVRRLPLTNKTAEKGRNFTEYYDERGRRRAKWVFASYMREWGYDFPPGWGDSTPGYLEEVGYRAATSAMKVYWVFLKPYLWRKDWQAVRLRHDQRSA